MKMSGRSETQAEILWYLMVEVIMFTFVALAHGGLLFTGHNDARAAMIEGAIAVVLAAALITSFVSPAQTRMMALLTQGLALLALVGGLIAIAMNVIARTTANAAVYVIMLITVIFGLIVAQRGVTP